MDQCNSCRCNQGCNKPCNNRCSCNTGEMACQRETRAEAEADARYEDTMTYSRPSCYKEKTCNNEAYECPEVANDQVGCMPIAMAYVPWQQWGDVFTGECGLDHGTIFPELVKPFWVSCGQNR